MAEAELSRWILLVQAFATLALVGLIWTIQIVHYPLFVFADRGRFLELHAEHSQRITWLVAPLMLVELASAVAWLLARPVAVSGLAAWSGLSLLVLIWASTWMLQVPQHEILGRGFDAAALRFLVASNWLRTLAWTARGALVSWWLASAMGT